MTSNAEERETDHNGESDLGLGCLSDGEGQHKLDADKEAIHELEVDLVEGAGPDEPGGVEERRDRVDCCQVVVVVEGWDAQSELLVDVDDVVAEDWTIGEELEEKLAVE